MFQSPSARRRNCPSSALHFTLLEDPQNPCHRSIGHGRVRFNHNTLIETHQDVQHQPGAPRRLQPSNGPTFHVMPVQMHLQNLLGPAYDGVDGSLSPSIFSPSGYLVSSTFADIDRSLPLSLSLVIARWLRSTSFLYPRTRPTMMILGLSKSCSVAALQLVKHQPKTSATEACITLGMQSSLVHSSSPAPLGMLKDYFPFFRFSSSCQLRIIHSLYLQYQIPDAYLFSFMDPSRISALCTTDAGIRGAIPQLTVLSSCWGSSQIAGIRSWKIKEFISTPELRFPGPLPQASSKQLGSGSASPLRPVRSLELHYR